MGIESKAYPTGEQNLNPNKSDGQSLSQPPIRCLKFEYKLNLF